MQPHSAIIKLGFFFFKDLSAPTLPKTLSSAFSRTAQVLKTIISAFSQEFAKSHPIAESIPFNFSESEAFC